MSKAKLRYCKSKVENTKHYDQSKWYKVVYKLAVAEELGGVTPLPENGYYREITKCLYKTMERHRAN